MTTYRIVPAEPSAEQIERGVDVEPTHESTVRAIYLAMTEQCPEVSGKPVVWKCEMAQEDGTVRTMFVEQDPDGLRFNDMGEPSPFRVTPLYTTPQPEVKDLNQWTAELLQRQQSLPSDIRAAMNADPSALMESDDTAPQPDQRDAEIARLKEAARVALADELAPVFPKAPAITEADVPY